MLPLLTLTLALADPLASLLAGDVSAAADLVGSHGFEAVDAGLRELRAGQPTAQGRYAIVAPPPSGRASPRAPPRTWCTCLTDAACWCGSKAGSRSAPITSATGGSGWDRIRWSEREERGWGAPEELGPTHMIVQTFVDASGAMHLFAHGYNNDPDTNSQGVPPGKYQVYLATLQRGGFSRWRPLFDELPDLLHGWDVRDTEDGGLLLAWAPWYRGQHYGRPGQRLVQRRIGPRGLGPVEELPSREGFNVMRPQFVGDDLYAVAQSADYQDIDIVKIGEAVDLAHEPASFLLSPMSQPGAPDELVWEGTDPQRTLHIGERELPIPAWGDSLGGLPVPLLQKLADAAAAAPVPPADAPTISALELLLIFVGGMVLFGLIRAVRWVFSLLKMPTTTRQRLRRAAPIIEVSVWMVFVASVIAWTLQGHPIVRLLVLGLLALVVVVALWFLIRDYLAGVVFRTEMTIRRGDTIRFGGYEGTVKRFGARTMTLELTHGDVAFVPYREVREAVLVRRHRRLASTRHTFDIEVPPTLGIAEARATVRRAALLNHWSSPSDEPHIAPIDHDSMRVTIYALGDARSADIEAGVRNALAAASAGNR